MTGIFLSSAPPRHLPLRDPAILLLIPYRRLPPSKPEEVPSWHVLRRLGKLEKLAPRLCWRIAFPWRRLTARQYGGLSLNCISGELRVNVLGFKVVTADSSEVHMSPATRKVASVLAATVLVL